MKRVFMLYLVLLYTIAGFSQADTIRKNLPVFERITAGVNVYKLDTSSAPDDRLTRKIKELRNLRGGFNVNEAIDFKLEEDRQNKELSEKEINELTHYFKSGAGKQWLDNAIIWIYRNHFTYKELKQMVKFYQTSAGQKLADEFPIIMMQSLAAAQMIKDAFSKQQKP